MPLPIIPNGFMFLAGLSSAESTMMPLVLVALMLDSLIIAGWYLAGVAINNNAVKASARTELYQLVGTAILMVVLLWVLLTFSSIFYTVLGGTYLMNPQAIYTMCTNIKSGTQLNLLGSSSGLMVQQPGSVFPGLCKLTDPSNAGKITDRDTYKIDYPLAATGVIMANLTNQTARNYNDAFIINAYIGFLQTLKPFTNVCFSLPGDPTCMLPGAITPDTAWHLEFVPFAGYDLAYRSLSTYSMMMVLALESFIAQFVGISVLLNFWPFLIFIGILARGNPFTRTLGGLVIAVVIGGLLFFPVTFSIEYLALAHGVSTTVTTQSTYGFNAITAIPQKYQDYPGNYITTNYVTNFFILPNVKRMATADGCYPPDVHGLLGTEAVDFVAMSTVGAISEINTLLHLAGGGIFFAAAGSFDPTAIYHIQYECTPTQVLNTIFGLFDIYGVSGISAYLLPFLNVFIVLSAVKGLSGLLGGDTSLLGLGRLV